MVEVSPHFDSPRLCIARAREHAGEVERETRAFFERKPYVRIIDIDHQTREQVHKIRLTAKLPGRLSAVVKDAVSNLRDALDHAVYGATVALGISEPKATKFPFASTPEGVKGQLEGRFCKDIPPEIHPLLMGFNPHQTGDHLLWGLNQVRNPNAHRIIVPVGVANMGNSLHVRSAMINGGRLGYSKWNPAKDEIEYLRIGSGSHIDYEVQVAFDVTFSDIEGIANKPVVSALAALAHKVEEVVTSIENKTAEIISNRI